MFKTLTTLTTLATTALMGVTPALAGQSNHGDHVRLSQAVERVGVNVYVNHKICDEVDALGLYIADHKAVVICQENRRPGSTNVVRWTEEDYDTLRHEVHHVVQDCRNGLDGQLSKIYGDPIELGYRVLGKNGTNWVAEMYARDGASGHIQVMEIEAFAVAAMNDPIEQIRDINTYCF